MRMVKFGALAVAASIFSAQPVAAADIFVQFGGPNQQSGRAVVGQTGDFWNVLMGHSGTSSLSKTDGSSSGASISYNAPGLYTAPSGTFAFDNTQAENVMQSYLFGQSPISVTFSGLDSNRRYSLFALTQGDNNTVGRRHDLTVNGVTKSNLNSNASTYIEGDNFARFNVRADKNGNISLLNQRGIGEANLNGIQLAAGAIPEPGTWALMLIGFGAIGASMRRKKSAGIFGRRLAAA